MSCAGRSMQAGFFDPRAVPIYFAARLALAAAFGVGALLLLPLVFDQMTTSSVWLWSAISGLAGYLSPSFYLKRRIGRRADAAPDGISRTSWT